MKRLNFFLSSLTAEDMAALMPMMEEVSLSAAQILYDVDDAVTDLYFPGSACVSIVTAMTDGKTVETSTIGRESACGLLDVLTDRTSRSGLFAQIAGSATKLPAAAFRERLALSPALLSLSLLHVRASAVQAEQGVACNIAHEGHKRLARWLLMTQDRVGAMTFPLTQEYMAVMTGVQRSTISVMAGALKKAGVIDYSRGALTVRDRAALIDHACECYAVVGEQFEALRTGSGD